MQSAIADISPEALAAALRDSEGVDVDLSTPGGRQLLEKAVAGAHSNPEGLDRLLDALHAHRHASPREEADRDHPGEILLLDRGSQPDRWGIPPIGSAEFDACLREPSLGDAESVPESVPPTPRILGFDETVVKPSGEEDFRQFELILFNVENELTRRLYKKPSLFERIGSFFRYRSPSFVMTNQSSCFRQAEAWRGDTQTLQIQSLLSGQTLYWRMAVKGKVTVKDQMSLADMNRSVQRIANAISSEVDMGGLVAIHALRHARGFECWQYPSNFSALRDHASRPT